jgi:hypothetical protein
MNVRSNRPLRGIGIFFMVVSGLALGCPVLFTLIFLGLDWLGPISVGDSTYATHSHTEMGNGGAVWLGAYSVVFIALFGWGFALSRPRGPLP